MWYRYILKKKYVKINDELKEYLMKYDTYLSRLNDNMVARILPSKSCKYSKNPSKSTTLLIKYTEFLKSLIFLIK